MQKTSTPALVLDGKPIPIKKRPKTLGDLLIAADESCAERGRIVTDVRLDGDDEPSFRDPHVVNRKASSLRRVEIESGTPAELARRCLAEAGLALQGLAHAARDVALRLRAGDITGGNRDLAVISQGMATAVTITGAASLGLGVDLAALETGSGTLGGAAERAARDLEAVIDAQGAGDWAGVAGMLEAKLVSDLLAWGGMCAGLQVEAARPIAVSASDFSDQGR